MTIYRCCCLRKSLIKWCVGKYNDQWPWLAKMIWQRSNKRAFSRRSGVSGGGGSSYDGSIKKLAFLPNCKQQHARVASSIRDCRCAVSTAAITTIMAVRRTAVAIISQEGGIISSAILSISILHHLRHRWRCLLHIVVVIVCQVTCRTLINES